LNSYATEHMGPHLDIIYKLNLALFVLLLCICIFFCPIIFFDGNKENKQTNKPWYGKV